LFKKERHSPIEQPSRRAQAVLARNVGLLPFGVTACAMLLAR
jgi:hypothetical protein